jgi:hypothetical protein
MWLRGPTQGETRVRVVEPAGAALSSPPSPSRRFLDGMAHTRHRCARVGRPIFMSAFVGLMLTSVITGSGSNGPAGASLVPASPLHQQEAGLSKILVIMEENHSVGQVFPSQMPYLWSLARRYGWATSWSDVGHPSLPNYLAIFGGSAFNDPQDCLPASGCTYPGPSVFGQAVAHGASARS